MYRDGTVFKECKMATFRDLTVEDKELVLQSLQESVDGCIARASRATLAGVKAEFEKQAERYRAVKSALVMAK